jgi:hypothetical protein
MIHSLFLSNFPQRAGERGDGFSIAQKRRGVKSQFAFLSAGKKAPAQDLRGVRGYTV